MGFRVGKGLCLEGERRQRPVKMRAQGTLSSRVLSLSSQVRKLDNGSLILVLPISAPLSSRRFIMAFLKRGLQRKSRKGEKAIARSACRSLCSMLSVPRYASNMREGGEGGWTSEGCRSRLLIGVCLSGWLSPSRSIGNRMAKKVMEEGKEQGKEHGGPHYQLQRARGPCTGLDAPFLR